jgi:GntR family transcriptional regulator, transcriptional repressor for pyruvate dehydrogenase complex
MVDRTGDSEREDGSFEPVRRQRGYEHIYEQIRTAIFEGRYKPGDRLPAEREMAQIFGVSRNGVREAVRGLASTGLVEIRLGVSGGVFVAPGNFGTVTQSMEDLASLGALRPDSLLEARIQLTSIVLRLACERASEEDLQRIEADIELTEKHYTRPGTERNAQIIEFYRLLAMATHNEVLVLLTEALAKAVFVRTQRGNPKLNPEIGQLRRRIVEYVRVGDADAAIHELTQQLQRLEDSMLEVEAERAALALEVSDEQPDSPA